ncbi:MAG TPA: UDP-N-acetylmuramoyl-L-alanyl-D-glutamate--2,6-diaminopimelate ligase [bacterium]|jgi:UDP-N-acetylmuramoyl-L-alanyl-D-glutamate--2,6-diaminopimelate ligase|nr:UDP-N-acetylmuramoyl-L-alanyl-D-glutamate--2,6-diaminopimelate ligase [bacterium]
MAALPKALPLAALLRKAGLSGSGLRGTVTGLEHDSRRVKAGAVFFALPSASGKAADTAAHARDAAAKGALAVVASPAVLRKAGLGALGVASPDVVGAYACLCAAAYGFPARRLELSGVTGTNGKTTTAFLLRGILDPERRSSALLGTVGYWVGRRFHDAPNTTPSALDLQALFAEALAAGCDRAVMEVSSHALDQRRVEGLSYTVALFTNLTRDHMDYHRTVAAYAKAKARLFGLLKPSGTAVVNAADPYAARMAAARTRGARVLRYHAAGGKAELRAEDVELGLDATRFTLCFGGKRLALRFPMPGRFNVANALAAAGGALAQGRSLHAVAAGLEKPHLPPGRFEQVRAGQPFNVVVDYAHTPDALERLIKTARECTPGRVITVFGCGGDRDRGKRPMMGALSARLSDLSFATSDNPRTERPAAILDDIFAGIADKALPKVRRVADRAKAIRAAVSAARPGDSVLLAGKGHEDYQIVGAVRHPFDDRVQARTALAALGWGRARGKR